MDPQHWDLPLAIVVALILIDKGITWTKFLIGRRNGNPGHATHRELRESMDRTDKRLDDAGVRMSNLSNIIQAMPDKIKTEWREEVRSIHDRITGIGERVARIEGRSGGADRGV